MGRDPDGSKKALAIFSSDAPELEVIRSLVDIGLDYTVCTCPNEALSRLRNESHLFDIAMVGLEYESMSGPELAWRLRQRHPRMPIVMLAPDLGKWEAEEIYDCGVNVLLSEIAEVDALRGHIRLVLQRLLADAETGQQAKMYEQAVVEALGGRDLAARLVSAERLILYENARLRRIVGNNCGRNCFQFWGLEDACADCPAVEALERGSRVSKVGRRPDGGKVRVDAVPVTPADGTRAVVEIFHFIDSD